jgi:tetratricopeptide (TPR) repeat protein
MEFFPKSVNAYEKKGNVFYEMKNFDKAIIYYDHCIELDNSYKGLKNYKKALNFIQSNNKTIDQCLKEKKAPNITKFIKFKDLEENDYIFECLKCNKVS